MNYIMIAKIVLPVILAALIIGKRNFFRAIPISGYAYVMAWLLVNLWLPMDKSLSIGILRIQCALGKSHF